MKAPGIVFLPLSIALTALALACGSDPGPNEADHAASVETTTVAEMTEATPEPSAVPATGAVALANEISSDPFGAESASAANQAPTLLAVEIVPSDAILTDDDVTAIPSAQDPDGDPIDFRYRWNVNGRPVRIDGPTLPARHFGRGDRIEVTVEADDGDEASFPLRTEPRVVSNSVPRITSTPGPLDPDGTFRYAVGADDADEDRGFRYALREHPEGMQIDEINGAITWTPRPDQAGVHPVTVAVDDRHDGLATQSFDLTIEFQATSPPAAAAP